MFIRPAAAAVTLALAASLTSVGVAAAPAGATAPAAYSATSAPRSVTAEPVARKRLSRAAQKTAQKTAQKAAKKARKQRKRLQTVGTPPEPVPAPVPPVAGTPAEIAIAFARAQLGDPYGWGGSGPDVWDCSGLTMRAWEAAGVLLPRTTVEQYRATTPITAAQLLPGDLVFWASNPARPRTIHHVAIYLGADRILHAPNPERPVEEQALTYNGTPAFFTRPGLVSG